MGMLEDVGLEPTSKPKKKIQRRFSERWRWWLVKWATFFGKEMCHHRTSQYLGWQFGRRRLMVQKSQTTRWHGATFSLEIMGVFTITKTGARRTSEPSTVLLVIILLGLGTKCVKNLFIFPINLHYPLSQCSGWAQSVLYWLYCSDKCWNILRREFCIFFVWLNCRSCR